MENKRENFWVLEHGIEWRELMQSKGIIMSSKTDWDLWIPRHHHHRHDHEMYGILYIAVGNPKNYVVSLDPAATDPTASVALPILTKQTEIL